MLLKMLPNMVVVSKFIFFQNYLKVLYAFNCARLNDLISELQNISMVLIVGSFVNHYSMNCLKNSIVVLLKERRQAPVGIK